MSFDCLPSAGDLARSSLSFDNDVHVMTLKAALAFMCVSFVVVVCYVIRKLSLVCCLGGLV